MSNPDIKVPTLDSLTLAFPISILFLLITMALFLLRDSIPLFNLVIWIGFPIITIIITGIVNVISQYITCKTTNIGKALLGTLPSIGTVLLGLGIASISYCRIPVTSVFAPLIIGQTIDVTKTKSNVNINTLKNGISKECCIPKLTLESIENKYPLIKGISYGFYIMFSILFGMTIGTGISTIC
jgi:hypothetical protein